MEIVKPYEDKELGDDEVQIILENYKCIDKELTLKNLIINLDKNQLREIIFRDNYRLKIPSILFLDNFTREMFTINEFRDFYNKI